MKVLQMRTAELAEMAAPYNPRRISEHDLGALQRSLRRFGAVEPIVVNRRSGRIVGGHQRVKAALAEGIATLPVVHVDLDEPSERQLNLALNRIRGEFDEEKLQLVLAELREVNADLEIAGFTPEEIAALLRGDQAPQEGLTDPDQVPDPPDNPSMQPGDLVLLGDHRLLCGDSAKREDVARLLDGARVQLLYTDPPYNVRVEPRSNNAIAAGLSNKGNVPLRKRAKTHHQRLDLGRHPEKAKPTGKMRAKDRALENDFISDEAFARLLRAWFGNLADALDPGRSFYIWGGYSNIKNFPGAIEQAGLYFSQAIIWHKQWPVLTRKDFMGDHEWAFYGWKTGNPDLICPTADGTAEIVAHQDCALFSRRDFSNDHRCCFYGWRSGAAHFFSRDYTNASDVWSVKKIAPPMMLHLTEKPVELGERAMTYSSRRGESVLDLFGGSGSTLIAAERMGRRAFLMEIDPAYCDVIVQRWQEFTGKRAEGWRGNPVRVLAPSVGQASRSARTSAEKRGRSLKEAREKRERSVGEAREKRERSVPEAREKRREARGGPPDESPRQDSEAHKAQGDLGQPGEAPAEQR